MTDAYSVLKHRSEFDLYSIKGDGDPFVTAAGLVVDWVVQKERGYDGSPIVDDFEGRRAFPRAWDYAMPEDYRGGDYDDDGWPALACAAVRDDADRVARWVMEYDEPDAHHDDRRWHTVVCIDRVADDACHVGVQSMCRPLPHCSEELPTTVAAPALVKEIVNLPWYVAKGGTTQIQTVPNKLSPQTFEHFKNALTDPGRKIRSCSSAPATTARSPRPPSSWHGAPWAPPTSTCSTGPTTSCAGRSRNSLSAGPPPASTPAPRGRAACTCPAST